MDSIIDNLLNTKEFNTYPILDVVEPILVAIESNNEWYLLYVLQDKHIRTKDGKRAYIYEVLVSKSNTDTIEKVTLGKLSIKDSLQSDSIFRVGKIGNKLFPPKKLVSLDEVKDVLPKDNFVLSAMIPNKADVDELLSKLKGGL